MLVSIVSLLGAHSFAAQPATSAANAVSIAAPGDPVSNRTQPFGLNRTQATCYSNQCQVVPFSIYYGVSRVVLDLSTAPSSTFTIDVNSTLGPAYLEQLQLAFFNDNYNTLPTVTSYWAFNGGSAYAGVSNSGVQCTPTQPSLYAALVAACDSTLTLKDPMGNPSIPIGPGTGNAPSAGVLVSISGVTGGQVTDHPMTITATVVAPVGAVVTISIYT